jgi:hypothetical protein
MGLVSGETASTMYMNDPSGRNTSWPTSGEGWVRRRRPSVHPVQQNDGSLVSQLMGQQHGSYVASGSNAYNIHYGARSLWWWGRRRQPVRLQLGPRRSAVSPQHLHVPQQQHQPIKTAANPAAAARRGNPSITPDSASRSCIQTRR